MGKGNKAVKAVAVVQATISNTANGGTKGNWQGYSVCTLLRNLGYMGYTTKQATQLLAQVGLSSTSPSTVGCQVGAGRQYAAGVAKPHHTGGAAALPAELAKTVAALVGAPANPVTPPAKAAPASKPAKAQKGTNKPAK